MFNILKNIANTMSCAIIGSDIWLQVASYEAPANNEVVDHREEKPTQIIEEGDRTRHVIEHENMVRNNFMDISMFTMLTACS